MAKFIIFACWTILTFPIITLALFGWDSTKTPSKISPSLLSTFESSEKANIIISFVGGNSQVLHSIEGQSFHSRTERIDSLVSSLKKESSRSQQNAKYFLQENSVKYRSFWVSNQMYIEGADKSLVEYMANFQEVAEIHEEIQIPMHAPVPVPDQNSVFLGHNSRQEEFAVEWNIEKLQTVEAWRIANGTGVVVSSIDTGVRHTHEALRHNFRGAEYGWYNPYERTGTPFDDDGHGTHIMGTIAGGMGIGVAPNATWIACRGCNLTTCTEANLIECGQWIVCPTRADGAAPNCSMVPALVSNSWGIGQGDSWYEGVTEAWVTAGIIPIFALGNSGPSCGSTNSPGDLARVIGVGSTNMEDRLSNFSSVGPAPDGRIKPDVTAPGENILSAFPDSDTAYGIKRGTSMACPHVAGVAALLLSITPDLTFEQVRSALTSGVDTNLLIQNQTCGGIPDNTFPNHHFGHGRTNALKVAQAAKLITA